MTSSMLPLVLSTVRSMRKKLKHHRANSFEMERVPYADTLNGAGIGTVAMGSAGAAAVRGGTDELRSECAE